MMHRLLAVLFLATLARGNNFNQQEQIQQHSNDQGVFNAFDSALGTSSFGAPVSGFGTSGFVSPTSAFGSPTSAFGSPTSAFGGPALGYPGFGQASTFGQVPTLGQSPTFDQRRMFVVPSSSTYGRTYAPLPMNYVANTPMMMPQPLESHLFAEPVYGSSMIGQPMLGSPGFGSSMYNSPMIGQPMYGSSMLGPQVSYSPPIVAESVYQPMMSPSYMEPSYLSAPYVDSTFIGSPGYQRSSMMPLGPPMMKTPVVGTAVFTQPVLLGDEEHDHHDSHK